MCRVTAILQLRLLGGVQGQQHLAGEGRRGAVRMLACVGGTAVGLHVPGCTAGRARPHWPGVLIMNAPHLL